MSNWIRLPDKHDNNKVTHKYINAAYVTVFEEVQLPAGEQYVQLTTNYGHDFTIPNADVAAIKRQLQIDDDMQ